MTSDVQNNFAGHLKARDTLIARNLIAIRVVRRDDWSGAKNRRPLGYLDVYPDKNEENLMSGHVRNFLTAPFDLISGTYALFS